MEQGKPLDGDWGTSFGGRDPAGPGFRRQRQGHAPISISHQIGETKLQKIHSLPWMQWGLALVLLSICGRDAWDGMEYAVKRENMVKKKKMEPPFLVSCPSSQASTSYSLLFFSSQPLPSLHTWSLPLPPATKLYSQYQLSADAPCLILSCLCNISPWLLRVHCKHHCSSGWSRAHFLTMDLTGTQLFSC